MEIFDSHAHYNSEQFDEDRDELLTRLNKEGVSHIINIGCDIPTSQESVDLAKKYDFVYATVGFHPHDAKSATGNYLEQLEEMAGYEKVVAIGEIGLDYYYDSSPRDVQKRVFEEQLQLAEKLNLPVSIHSREATEDTLELLQKYKPKGVVHCYTGSAETAKVLLDIGLHIGFTGVVTFKNAKKILKVIEIMPLDRILLETDCPYMAPEPFRGKRSTSDMILQTATTIADIKAIPVEELISIARENTIKLFIAK